MQTLRAAVVVVFILAMPTALAGPVLTWTGAQLLSETRASFPTQAPTEDGAAITFEYGTGFSGQGYAKLLVLNLDDLAPQEGPLRISVAVELTRLTCEVGLCSGGVNDWDPKLVIGDGNFYFGATIGDPDTVGAVELFDNGAYAGLVSNQPLFTGTGFPSIGNSTTVLMDFVLDSSSASSTVTALTQSNTFQAANPLQYTQGLQFLLLRDNDSGEQYRLNRLSVSTSQTLPEPPLLALLVVPAVGLVWVSRRKSTPALPS